MKQRRPTDREITRMVNSCLTIDLIEDEQSDLEQSIDEFCSNSYNEGKEDGDKEGYGRGLEDAFHSDNPTMEKLSTEYVVAQFAECITLSDFQEKLKEITNRSYNFMT